MISEADLRAVRSEAALYTLLRDRLGWPVDPHGLMTYDQPLPESDRATRIEVSQLVPFSGEDPFTILLAEFKTPFRRGALRKVLQAIRRRIREQGAFGGRAPEDLIFLCVLPGWSGVRFAHFREQEGRQPKLAVFGWDRDAVHETRTLRDVNLPALALNNGLFEGPNWNAETEARWRSAWDVERVTRQFFSDYADVFRAFEQQVRGVPDGEPRRLYTQQLMNRLLFCWFLQKKGWLNQWPDYLARLFAVACRDKEPGQRRREDNFLRDYLHPLFYEMLNCPTDERPANPRYVELQDRLGDVAFLNGGLFEPQPETDDVVAIANAAFEPLFELLGRYQFTVTESMPDDVEVAVDPEMLGKVFEELVTGRHETGSYYTPKVVVSFMCREALKCYLERMMPDAPPDAIVAFVDRHDPRELSNPVQVLRTLEDVRVCDPACGSGAYLLGMMHELVDLQRCVYAVRRVDDRSIYDWKLRVIRRNLYGVDRDPFAVSIARLRLWLSLSVEFEGNPPPPLPNLDFSVEMGDSLAGQPPPNVAQLQLAQQQIAQYAEAKEQHKVASGPTKATFRKRVDELRRDLGTWLRSAGGSSTGLDWGVEFAEVFGAPSLAGGARGGFDIIVANPPYVRSGATFNHVVDEAERLRSMAEWNEYRQDLAGMGAYRTLRGKWDLYIPFLERSFQLLAPRGHMVMIISDAYNASGYAAASHDLLLTNGTIRRVDFCTDIPLFRAGVANTIVGVTKGPSEDTWAPARVRRWGEGPEDFAQNEEQLPTGLQRTLGRRVFRVNAGAATQHRVDTVPLEHICYVSQGMVLHRSTRGPGFFRAEDLVAPRASAVHVKPYVEGKDITRWRIAEHRWLEYGTQRCPSQCHRPTFGELHEARPKLIAQRMCGERPEVALDEQALFSNHTAIVFVRWCDLKGVRNRSLTLAARYGDQSPGKHAGRPQRESLEELSAAFAPEYLLSVMNSATCRAQLAQERQGNLDLYANDWRTLFIPLISVVEQGQLVAKVRALRDLLLGGVPSDASEVVALETDIDEVVANLYAG